MDGWLGIGGSFDFRAAGMGLVGRLWSMFLLSILSLLSL